MSQRPGGHGLADLEHHNIRCEITDRVSDECPVWGSCTVVAFLDIECNPNFERHLNLYLREYVPISKKCFC